MSDTSILVYIRKRATVFYLPPGGRGTAIAVEGACVTLELDELHCNALSLTRLRRELPPGGSLPLRRGCSSAKVLPEPPVLYTEKTPGRIPPACGVFVCSDARIGGLSAPGRASAFGEAISFRAVCRGTRRRSGRAWSPRRRSRRRAGGRLPRRRPTRRIRRGRLR